jgi:hypothetical protein
MDEAGVVLAAQAMELRQAPKRSSAPGSLAHPHAIGFAVGTVEGIAWNNGIVVAGNEPVR